MFEEEIKMEEKSFNIVPLLLVLALVVALIGGAVYFIQDSRKTLSQQDATALVESILKAQGPATVHFHAGIVKPSVDEKPRDPHYKLLQMAGFLKVADVKGRDAVQVALTPAAKNAFLKLPDVITRKEVDGSTSYTVPLARRKLIAVAKVTMKNPKFAQVEYTWQWQPNLLGDVFDASSSTFGKLNTWDRALVIQKYGGDFYHAPPQTATLAVVRNSKGWSVYSE